MFVDLDGTLVDTSYLHTFAWWRALDDAYRPVPMADIHPLIGMGDKELLEALIGENDSSIAKSHGRYFSGLYEFIRPLPGAGELIGKLAAEGTRVVVVTSAKGAALAALLGSLGCDDVIVDVVHGEMSPRSKPSPDLFAIALERSSAAPSMVLALGDSIWDIEAAARAGIACVAVETGGTNRTRLEQAGAIAVYPSCAAIVTSFETTPFATLLGGAKKTREKAPLGQEDQASGAQERLVS